MFHFVNRPLPQVLSFIDSGVVALVEVRACPVSVKQGLDFSVASGAYLKKRVVGCSFAGPDVVEHSRVQSHGLLDLPVGEELPVNFLGRFEDGWFVRPQA